MIDGILSAADDGQKNYVVVDGKLYDVERQTATKTDAFVEKLPPWLEKSVESLANLALVKSHATKDMSSLPIFELVIYNSKHPAEAKMLCDLPGSPRLDDNGKIFLKHGAIELVATIPFWLAIAGNVVVFLMTWR